MKKRWLITENGRECINCGIFKVWSEFYKHRNSTRGHSNSCISCDKALALAYKHKIKKLIFTHYGNRCACCGESNIKFLTLDHVENNGAEHRRELGGRNNKYLRSNAGAGSQVLYTWIRKNNFPDSIQLLCWNCNSGKHFNNGVCPHKEEECLQDS